MTHSVSHSRRQAVCLVVAMIVSVLVGVPVQSEAAPAAAKVVRIKALPGSHLVVPKARTVDARGRQVATTLKSLRAVVRGPHAAQVSKGLRVTVLRGTKGGTKTIWRKVSRSSTSDGGRFKATLVGLPQRTYQFRVVVAGTGLRTYRSRPFTASLGGRAPLPEPSTTMASELTLSPDQTHLTYVRPAKKVARDSWVDSLAIYEVATGTTSVVDPLPVGVVPNGSVEALSVSPDRRHVAYWSAATNLTADQDVNDVDDAFVKDLRTGVVSRVNLGPWGTSHGGSHHSSDAIVWSPDSGTIALNGGESRYEIWSYRLADGASHEIADAGCSVTATGFTSDGSKVFTGAYDGASTRANIAEVRDYAEGEVSAGEDVPFTASGDVRPFDPQQSWTSVTARIVGDDLAFVTAGRWSRDSWATSPKRRQWSLWRPSTGEVLQTGLLSTSSYGLKQDRYLIRGGDPKTEASGTIHVVDIHSAADRSLRLREVSKPGLGETPVTENGNWVGVLLTDVSADGRLFAYAMDRRTPSGATKFVVVRDLDTGQEIEIPNASMPVFVGGRLAVIRGERVAVVPVNL